MRECTDYVGDQDDVLRGAVIGYFVTFIIFSNYLLLNVFVAVVLKNFEDEALGADDKGSQSPAPRSLFLAFGEVWSKHASGYTMEISKLKPFLQELVAETKFWVPPDAFKPGPYLRLMKRLKIPQLNGQVHCLDVSLALTILKIYPVSFISMSSL